MGLIRHRCPVPDQVRDWIDTQLAWCVAEFGEPALRAPVLLPSADFFPRPFTGGRAEALRVVDGMCRHMGIERDLVRVEYDGEDAAGGAASADELLASLPGFSTRSSGAAGHYRRVGGRAVLTIDAGLTREPVTLVATIAHELGHQRLLGEGRVTTERPDHEPLTDLLTVFLGTGLFTANAAFQYTQTSRSWGTRRLGYLDQAAFGYALARYARLRGEADPPWAAHLTTNPRAYLRQGLRYLSRLG